MNILNHKRKNWMTLASALLTRCGSVNIIFVASILERSWCIESWVRLLGDGLNDRQKGDDMSASLGRRFCRC